MTMAGKWVWRAVARASGRCWRSRGPVLALVVGLCGARPASAWEPSAPVELIVPAGRGGGADQMARLLQGAITKHSLLKQPVVVVNKSGGAGAEGFLHMKASAGNPHKLLMALSNLFTTPLASKIPFRHRDLTPVGMLALDQFVLWVSGDAPYTSTREYLDAIRAAPDHRFSMGGTGLKQEDQLLTVALQKVLGKKLEYVSFRGGGDVASELVAGRVSSSVNNPVEALPHWREGKLRALCVFRTERMPQMQKVAGALAWSDIPTCGAAGIDVDYQMLRAVFLPSGASAEQVAFYKELLERVRELPEWHEFIEAGAFDDRFLTGAAFAEWLQRAEAQHERWMKDAGFIPE